MIYSEAAVALTMDAALRTISIIPCRDLATTRLGLMNFNITCSKQFELLS